MDFYKAIKGFKPDPNCKACKGTGTYFENVDSVGWSVVCGCITDQLDAEPAPVFDYTSTADVDELGNEYCIVCGDLIDNHAKPCEVQA